MRILTPLACVLLVSCAAADDGPDAAGRPADAPAAAGTATRVVESRGAGEWGAVRLVEELRIGSLEGADEYIFGAVQHVAVTEDGSIVVADGQGPRLRLYSPAGRFVRTIGGIGAGPGEYRGVVGLGVTRDNRITVWDLPNARVNLYSAAGEYERMFRAVSGSWGGDSFRIDTAGNFWVYTSLPTAAALAYHPEGAVEGPGMRRGAYLRFSADGTPLDTVFMPEPPAFGPARSPSFVLMAAEGPLEPFVPSFAVALSPHGYFVTGANEEYALVLHRPDGRLRIEREHTPVALTRGERAQWEARAAFYSRRGGASAGVVIPAVKPAFRALSVDEDGRIWVDRYVAARERDDLPPQQPDAPPRLTWREPRTFDVFEPDGRFLGTVVVPDNVRIRLRHGDTLWGVARGVLDEHYVVRYRMER